MIKNKFIFHIFIRSFFLEALWNFERMQNVGFVYILHPILKKLYPDEQMRKKEILKHFEFFNTHPYMASIIIGISASMHKEIIDKKTISHDEISLIKTNMAGPLAAMGDTFFWATWRTFAALLAASMIILFKDINSFRATWFIPLFFLFIFNVVHIPFRYWSLKTSYNIRIRIIKIVAGLQLNRAITMVHYAGLVILLYLLLYYFISNLENLMHTMIFAVIFLISLFLGAIRLRPATIFYAIIFLSIAASLII